MRTIGVRELKEHASEILREVREQRAEYIVTHRGRAIARLTPAEPPPRPSQAEIEAYLTELDKIGAEIAKQWPEGVTLEDVMRDDLRREL
jgi:prevent-host-death family protein